MSAGTNCIATNRPAVAIGLSVSSKTTTASAISPSQFPSSFVEVGEGETLEARQAKRRRPPPMIAHKWAIVFITWTK